MTTKKKDPIDRMVLITNLTYAVLNGVRAHVRAILLMEHEERLLGSGPRWQIRGFGTDPAWEVFDIDVSSIEFTMTDAAGNDIFICGDGETRPLIQGAILKIANGGPELSLICDDYKQPIRVDRFEGPASESPILQVWSVLTERVAQFWKAPYMPGLTHAAPNIIVAMSKARR